MIQDEKEIMEVTPMDTKDSSVLSSSRKLCRSTVCASLKQWRLCGIALLSAFLLVLLVTFGIFHFRHPASLRAAKKGTSNALVDGTVFGTTDKDKKFTTGSAVGQEKVPFLRCVPTGYDASNATRVEIMLLHGASFRKEKWLYHSENIDGEEKIYPQGMLGEFCVSKVGGVSVAVTALDLNVGGATAERLLSLIRSVYGSEQDRNARLVVVTPSASGAFVVDWIIKGGGGSANLPSLSSIVDGWVPVAAYSVLSNAQNIQAATQTGNWPPVLAVYGKKDEKGETSTELLKANYGIGGTLVRKKKIKNAHHPAYLDDSGYFVSSVLSFITETVF